MQASAIPDPPVTHGRATILLLAAIAALASLATQLLVPTLPLIASDLRVSAGEAQLTVSLFLLGLAGAQLLVGPLSDQLGRKPVLLAGMALFVAGSLLGAFAANLPSLLAARLAQALGGAAGIVSGRVLVADLFPAQEHAARQATLMSVILVSPALAPVIGGFLGELAGWRSIFVVLTVVGLVVTAFTAIRLPGRIGTANHPLSATGMRGALANRCFLGPALAVAGGSASLYMFLANAPFLLAHDHALSPREVGAFLMVAAGSSIGGTFLVAPIERRGSALLTGSATLFVAAFALLIGTLGGLTSMWFFMATTALLGFGAGMSGPAGIARIIRSAPGREGTATSLAGAAQMLASAASTAFLASFGNATTLRLAIGLTLGCLCAVAGALLSRRSRDPMQGLA